MSAEPQPGAFRHQHDDPRGLIERIEAQLRERIAEAVEMAGLKLMVDLRERAGRPAPETTSEADRREFLETATALLRHLRDAFHAGLPSEERAALEAAEAAPADSQDRVLAGQVFLARQLPDYWQRFESYRAAYFEARLSAPAPRAGWLRRLLGRP
jgi:hypothetical protein